VEVKAQKADREALNQLNRYVAGLHEYFRNKRDLVFAGILAAPRFSPEIEAIAARPTSALGIIRVGQSA